MGENVTLVVTATPNPNEMASVQEYLQSATPLLIGAGGTVVKRVKVAQVLKGDAVGVVMMMDFATAEAIEQVFASDAYAALVPVRDKGFLDMTILIAKDL